MFEDWTKEFQKTDLPVYIAEDPLRAVEEQVWRLKPFEI
jgi:hypothetical protein